MDCQLCGWGWVFIALFAAIFILERKRFPI